MSPIKGSGLVACTVTDCQRPHLARGYCSLHYRRIHDWGSTEPRRPALEERFWQKVDRSGGPTGCWPWQGQHLAKGYGALKVGSLTDGTRRNALAHRISWELANGVAPEGLHVCHHCDNPPCVNPSHLFLGTASENHADKVSKGRQARGERQGSSRLTTADVLRIRALALQGQKHADIGSLFGVRQTQVSRIVRRAQWRHVS